MTELYEVKSNNKKLCHPDRSEAEWRDLLLGACVDSERA
jgi:hypothetical protein